MNERSPVPTEMAYLLKATGNLISVVTAWFLIVKVYAGLDFLMHTLFGV